jgi:hypothetical protein
MGGEGRRGDEAVAPVINPAGTKGEETRGDSVFTHAWVPGLTPFFFSHLLLLLAACETLFRFPFSAQHEPNTNFLILHLISFCTFSYYATKIKKVQKEL